MSKTTTKICTVPGGVAVVFHKAGRKLEESGVKMQDPLSSFASYEGHDVDYEPDINDMKRHAAEILSKRDAGPGTLAVVFPHADGRSELPTVSDTVKAVNDQLPKAGFMSCLTRRFG